MKKILSLIALCGAQLLIADAGAIPLVYNPHDQQLYVMLTLQRKRYTDRAVLTEIGGVSLSSETLEETLARRFKDELNLNFDSSRLLRNPVLISSRSYITRDSNPYKIYFYAMPFSDYEQLVTDVKQLQKSPVMAIVLVSLQDFFINIFGINNCFNINKLKIVKTSPDVDERCMVLWNIFRNGVKEALGVDIKGGNNAAYYENLITEKLLSFNIKTCLA